MNAITTATLATQDTHETLFGVPVLNDYHMNTGYDWMEDIAAAGWTVLPAWGSDGWDVGSWPYVMLALNRIHDAEGELFAMATYCEGDVKTTYYRTQSAQWAAITAYAFWQWKHGQADGPADLPESIEDLPAQYRTPYVVTGH